MSLSMAAILAAAPGEYLVDFGRESTLTTISEAALPQIAVASDYIRLSSAFGLILYTILDTIVRRKPSGLQTRWCADNNIHLLLQMVIVLHCIFLLCSELKSARLDLDASWMPLATYALAGVASIVNILGLVLRQASTARGCYHLISTLTLAWSISDSQDTVARANLPLLGAFALAFLLDTFHSTIPPQLPPPMTGLALSERFCYSWLTRAIGAPMGLDFDSLPEIGLLDDFDAYLGRLHASGTPNQVGAVPGIFWGFLIREHPRQLLSSGLLRLIDDASKFALPWLLSSLLTRPTPWNISLMFCSRIVGALCGNYSGYYLRQISAQYKAALSAALHAKTLRLGDFKVSNQGADLATLGEVDTQILYRAVLQFSDVWALPLQTVLCLAGLAYLLPWQALVAVIAVTAIVIPLTATFVKSIAYWVARNMSAKDHRTKLIIEALGVMQSIKMHAWESTFVDLIAERRSSELKTVQSTAISTSGLVCCMQGLPSLLVLASFGVIVFLNKELTSELVFASLLLFTMLNNSLIQISGLASIMQAIRTSSKRIEMHFNLSEAKLSPFSVHHIELGLPMYLECKELGWPGCPPLVTSGSLQINPGALTVITGGMGCGKSTLLLAILRHLEQRFSSLNHFEIGHVPQKPLLFGGSIRDNILFGKPYDKQWYTQVIHACCLDADFERLQNGDKTIIIGSSTLSGGQSARVSLARAAYRRAAIYLLDDPIAAIDVKVSSEIMRRLLGSSGLLAQSTRVVCTADTAILQHADAIHDLTDGAVNFRLGQAQILNTIVAMESTVRPEDLLSMGPTTSKDSCLRTSASYAIEAESPGAPLSNALGHDRIAHAPPNSKSPILAYLLSAKRSSWLKATSLLLLARASSVMGTYVLKMMANDTSGSILTRHLAIFGLSSLSQIALFFCFVLALYKLCIVPAASKLHRDLTVAILSQSMSFFQTTQVGDILNLFTNDISRIDGSLNSSIASLMGQYTNLAFSCGVLVVSSPLSLGFTIPLLAATYQLQLVYLSKLRELRRLDASSRTPLLEYLQEAEKGRVAFATYKVADSRLAQFNHYLENNLRALFPLSCLDLWLGVRLEVASVILQIVALGFLLARGVDSGTLGFVMTYLFQVTTTLSYIAKISAQCEADAVSVARIDEYSRMSEKGEICLDNHNTVVPYSDAGPDAAWPQSGKVEFQSISARYRPGLPNSLDSVTLAIEPGEKVAVVGRTGAGKSSLALSMLRMMDRTGGQILIDNVDVASVSPVHLRRSLAVMPQAQVVLASSVRKNLDPLGRHSDEEIMQCLETCGLLNTISKLFGAEKTGCTTSDSLLNIEIEDGSLFSKGENQIISLARAMLQKSKILVLDEATSGMDDSTEAFVHDLIFDKLRDTTVLAIMHRLNLTIHYDKVLVMDQGRVVSFGSPAALLADVEGPYFSMIQEDKELLSQARKYLGRA